MKMITRFVATLMALFVYLVPTAHASQIMTFDILVSGFVTVTGPGGETFEQGVVVKVNPLTGSQEVVASDGLMLKPEGIAADTAGNVYIAESDRVIRIDAETGEQTSLSSGGFLIDVRDIAVDSQGIPLVIAHLPEQRPFQPATIVSIDPVTGGQDIINRGVSVEYRLGLALASSGSGDIAFMNPGGCGGGCFSVVTITDVPISFKLANLGRANDIAFSDDSSSFISLNENSTFCGANCAFLGPGILDLNSLNSFPPGRTSNWIRTGCEWGYYRRPL